MDIIHELLIWYNPNLRLNFKKKWFDKRIRTLNDIVNTYGKPLDLAEFQEKIPFDYQILEYGDFCKQIQNFLRYRIFHNLKLPFQEIAILTS